MNVTRRSVLTSTLGGNLLLSRLCAASGRTRVDVANRAWRINGTVTYPGAEAEGLLMNVRMVNAVFEDANVNTSPRGFDPAENTAAFGKQAPEYIAHGIRGFTIGLQGGDPGYEGAVNSAIHANGTLSRPYLNRVAGVIETGERLGRAVILSCFYQRQAQILKDEKAIEAAVVNVADSDPKERISQRSSEITNEFGHKGFKHELLRSPSGQADLIRLAKRTAPSLLVSTSGLGNGRIPAEVAAAADYLTTHLNTTALAEIPQRMADLKKFGKPIVVNEDDKTGVEGAQSARACIDNGASWGYMDVKVNQHYPFRFRGANDDPAVYAVLKHATTPGDYFPPPDSAGGWRTVADFAGIPQTNREKLDVAFDFVRRTTKNGGLLVLRNGWLVYERYFGLGHRDATPNLASCGKSFTSVAMGILLQQMPDAFPEGLDQQVFTPDYLPPEAFPLSDPRRKEIKLGQLLAMTAGIRGNNPVYVDGKQQTIDPAGPDGAVACVDAVAFGKQEGVYQQRPYSTRSLWCAPGGGYSYAIFPAHLVSAIIRHVSGGELKEFVEKYRPSRLAGGSGDMGTRTLRI